MGVRLLIIFFVVVACAQTPESGDGSSLQEQSDGSEESHRNIAAYEKTVKNQDENQKSRRRPRDQGEQNDQSSHQDELISTCIARNKVTRQVYTPVANIAAIAKVAALTDCVEKTIKQQKNPCDCEIAACSPIEAPTTVAELIAKILEDHFPGQKCS